MYDAIDTVANPVVNWVSHSNNFSRYTDTHFTYSIQIFEFHLIQYYLISFTLSIEVYLDKFLGTLQHYFMITTIQLNYL